MRNLAPPSGEVAISSQDNRFNEPRRTTKVHAEKFLKTVPEEFRDRVVGYVYGIGCGRSMVKVGRAKHLETRLADLSMGNPFTLTVRYCLSVWLGDLHEVEKWLHFRLRRQHLRGEWFSGLDQTFAQAFAEACVKFERAQWAHEKVGIQRPEYNHQQSFRVRFKNPYRKDEWNLHVLTAEQIVKAQQLVESDFDDAVFDPDDPSACSQAVHAEEG